MREATKEEKESVINYVESISVDTGINFYAIWQNEKVKGGECMTNEELEKELEKTKNSLYKLLSCLYGHTLGQSDIDFIMSDKPAFRQDNKG